MKQIKTFIIVMLITFTISSCGDEPWGPLLESKVNKRNPKYTVEIKTWDSAMAFGSGTSRLYVYKSGSKRKVAELRGGGRFSEVYWEDKDNLIVIDREWIHSAQKQGSRKLKYGKLTITNYCFAVNGGRLRNTSCDSLSLENGLLTFYNTDLDINFQRIISVPIDQYIFSYEIKNNIVRFESFSDIPSEPISDYSAAHNVWRIKLSDSNIAKLNYFISLQMD